MKASVEDFAACMEASTEEIEAEGAFMETSVKSAMEDTEDMKASPEVTRTGASTKASTKASMEVTSTKASMGAFMEVMGAFAEFMQAFMEVTSTEVLWKLPWSLPWKIWKI